MGDESETAHARAASHHEAASATRSTAEAPVTTLKITLDTKTPALTSGASQVPFALSKAINASLITAQKKQLARMARDFTLRRPQFAKLSVKITQFAKKTNPVGEIAIHPPGDRADIFAKFELGGIKRPKDGHDLAIPIVGSPVKRSARSVISAQNRPRALLSGANTVTARGKSKQVKRAKSFGGAFLRPAKDGKPGAIFIRQGSKIKLAYVLEPEAAIKPELHFEDTITQSVQQTFSSDFEREFANALRTART